MLRARELRAGAVLLLVGSLATPALSVALGVWGAAAGGAALSAGWWFLGSRIARG